MSIICPDCEARVPLYGSTSSAAQRLVEAAAITRIGCKEVPSGPTRHGQPPPTYLVWAGSRNKQGIALIDKLPEPAQALYIAQQLAGHLSLGKAVG